jgi:hypothetical protein
VALAELADKRRRVEAFELDGVEGAFVFASPFERMLLRVEVAGDFGVSRAGRLVRLNGPSESFDFLGLSTFDAPLCRLFSRIHTIVVNKSLYNR